MGLLKLKAVTAAVLAACALGWGAFAASGAGTGDQLDTKPTPVATKPPPPVYVNPADTTQPKPKWLETDLDRLKGTWRVAGMSESGKVIPFDRLKGPVDFGVVPLLSPQDGKATLVNLTEPVTFVFGDGTLQMPFLEEGKVWKHRAFSFALDEKKTPREITLFAANKPAGRGIYEFVGGFTLCSSCHGHPFVDKSATPALTEVWGLCGPARNDPKATSRAGLRLAISIDGKRPDKFGGPGVIVFDLTRPAAGPTPATPKTLADAQRELAPLVAEAEVADLESQAAKHALEAALADLEKFKRVAEKAQFTWAEANRRREQAQKKYELAKERLENKAPRPAGEVFTVHVRSLTAAEKVIRVKATGKDSVLEGLTYAAEAVAIKSDAVSVWVVRDRAILPVDLAAIRKGDAKTNHALKPGDQLFVQVKP